MNDFMKIVLASLYGLMIGSFLNVVIYRLPRAIMKEDKFSFGCLLWPASSAPCCGEKLVWYENIPMFSWLFLRGKCGHCHQPISPRYILVETLIAGAFALVVWRFGLTVTGGVYALFLVLAITLFFIDLETFLLPDCLTYSMMWLGLLSAALGYSFTTPSDAILGAALGYLLPWGVNAIYFLVRKQDGFGGGDFKLLAAIGAFVGWVNIVPILCGASILGLIVISVVSLINRKKLSMTQAFPFGPFLILSGLGFAIRGI